MFSSARRSGAMVLAASMFGAVSSYAVFGATAEAVSVPQSRCSFGITSITTASGWRPLGVGVSINNGTVSRRIIAQLTTDMGVDPGAEVRVGYSVDGGPVQEKVYGPGNLANHTEFWETRATMAVIPLPAGTHTVAPYWRISGVAGKNGFFESGCFTVEGRTN